MSADLESVTGREFIQAEAQVLRDHTASSLPDALYHALLASAALERVADEWLALDHEKAWILVPALIEKIQLFYMSGTAVLEWIMQPDDTPAANWNRRRQSAAEHLKGAIELFPEQRDALTTALSAVESENCPFVQVPCSIPQSSVGSRGRASNPQSALKGVAVREIERLLPPTLKSDFALLAELVTVAGLNMTRQNARGILLGGRT